jgi:hypothetical protein
MAQVVQHLSNKNELWIHTPVVPPIFFVVALTLSNSEYDYY